MQRISLSLSLACFFFCASAWPASLTGTLADGDALGIHALAWGGGGPLTIRSWHFGGGTDSQGTVVAANGFDTVISLFLGTDQTAVLVDANDDGGCPPANPNPYCGDSWLEFASLAAGDYLVVVSASPNIPMGTTLGSAFTTGFGPVGGSYHVDVVTAPEPAAAWLVLLSLGGLMLARRRAGLVLLPAALIAADFTPSDSASLQAALNSAQRGDRILLTAGVEYPGSFEVVGARGGSGWVTLTTQGFSVPAGVRVTPANAAGMARLRAANNGPALRFRDGAQYWRVVGVEFTVTPGIYNYGPIWLGNMETTLEQIPNWVEIDRCYVHGDLATGTSRALAANARNVRILNSHFADIASDWQETHAILGWTTPGPIQIINNYLEAAGVNILFGGVPTAIPGLIPSDIEIRRNHITKQTAWRTNGRNFFIKYLIDLKNARRVTIEGNIIENTWSDRGTGGRALIFGPRTESGQIPQAVVEDVVVTRNIIRDVGNAFLIFGQDDLAGGAAVGAARRFKIRDNLIERNDLSRSQPAFTNVFFDLNLGVDDVEITHNTAWSSDPAGYLFALRGLNLPMDNLRFENNLARLGQGVVSQTGQTGTAALAAVAPGAVFNRNALEGGGAAGLPPGNFFPPDSGAIGFANLTLGDFRLVPGSPFLKAGTDGKDLGADVANIGLITQGISATGPSPRCVTNVTLTQAVFPAAGGPGSATVTAPAGCVWLVSIPTGNWPVISAGSYSGIASGTASFVVPPLPVGTTSRVTSLLIGGWKLLLTQN